jgi:hypothetical protein
MVRDADFGGAIVGIGDDRVVVRMADTPGQVNLSVFRIDGSNPYLETLVIVPRYFGDADMANAVAYARRGSLLAQFGNGIVYANRSEPCQGDANSNRVVDGSDIGVLLNEWGASSPSTMADFNHDGQVNGADLGLLLSSWGPCPN